MGMERWDPVREMMTLRDAMDRLFQQSVVRPGQLFAGLRPDTIPVDVVERGDAYIVRAAVPGVKPEDVEVTVQGERLTIRAEAKSEEERSGDTWLVREQRSGTLQRSVTLPGAVNSERAEARSENGVLTLRLPKAQGALPRRISVGAGGRGPATTPAVSSAQGEPATAAPTQHHHGSSDHTAGGDLVTEQSQESFPASDPPSWTPERTG